MRTTLFLLAALVPFALWRPPSFESPAPTGGVTPPVLRVSPAWRTRAWPLDPSEKAVTSRAWRFEIRFPMAEKAARAILVIGSSANALPDAVTFRALLADTTRADAPRTVGGPSRPHRGLDEPAWSNEKNSAWIVPLRAGGAFLIGGITLDSAVVASHGGWMAAFDSTGTCRMAAPIREEAR